MRPPKFHEKVLCSWSATWYKNAELAQDEQRAHFSTVFSYQVTDQLQRANMVVILLTWFSHEKLTK